jgi:hypothetical protein
MSSFHAVTSALAFVIAATFSAHAQNSRLPIPEPLEIEHHEIFEAVEAATRSGGATGEAAKAAMDVLKPHFAKEEKFALPQLGALAEVTGQGTVFSPETSKDLVARTATFRAELPAMLEEHKRIGAALREMQKAAEAEKKEAVARLADKIIAHAGMEEKVLYPASLLVGEYAGVTGRAR